MLEDHPVLLYTGAPQTGAHDIVIGCLITFGSNAFHVVKEAGRRWEVNKVFVDRMRDC